MRITESSDLPLIGLMALGDMLCGDADLVTMILGKFRAEVHSDVMA